MMTNTNDTLAALRTRALDAMRPATPVGVAPREDLYATITVTLPDGSIGVAAAVSVAQATMPGGYTWPVSVLQGKRCDSWHVSQLS